MILCQKSCPGLLFRLLKQCENPRRFYFIHSRKEKNMIRKFRFGTPLNTEAVVEEHPVEKGPIPHIELKEGEHISFQMTKGAPVYGLGEQVRGINKRGWIYTSNCTDDPNHREDTHSLYGAHNFLIFAEAEPFGLFLDNPGKVTFDIGYTQQDTAVITMDSWDMDLYYIDGKDLKDIVKQFRHEPLGL